MATCITPMNLDDLDLPAEFDGLEGPLQADLAAIVSMVAERAHERLLLTRRESRQLRAQLWNGLAESLNATLKPLTVENR
jgi:hypothetical protein